MKSRTPQDALGEFLAEFRRQHGLTLDDIATESRRWGSTWGPVSVRNIEQGRAAITVSTLLTLAVALRALTSQPLRITDLFGDAEALHVFGDLSPVRREWFDGALSGEPVEPGLLDIADGPKRVAEALERVLAQLPDLPDPIDDFELLGAYPGPTLAEARAAQRLKMSPLIFGLWARRLWGRSLDDEAALRAGSSSAQARGNATRKLVDEVRAAQKASEASRG